MNTDNSEPRRQSFKAYYLEPKSERGNFVQYMEESGVNAILIDAVSKLFQVTDKPENSIEWFRLYFRQFESDRTDMLQKSEQSFKDALIKQESKLTYLRMTESRLKEKLEGLQYEAKQAELLALRENQDENYHRYKDHADDFRWRIKPDPLYRVKKVDILGEMTENEVKDKEITFTPSVQKSDAEFTSQKIIPVEDRGCVDPDDNYDDYPLLYFGTKAEPAEEEVEISSLLDQLDPNQKASDGKKSLILEKADEEFEDEEFEEEEYNYEENEEYLGAMKSNPAARRSTGSQVKPGAAPATMTRERKKVKKGSKQPRLQSTEEVLGESSGASAGQTRNSGHRYSASEEAHKIGDPSVPTSGAGDLSDNRRKKKGKTKASKSEVLTPLPEDPLALELEPVDPSFWKQDFSVTKGREAMFDATDEFDFEDEFVEDIEYAGSYLSSRRERRQRKFRSQIINEAFWKPDRGASIQFDSKFDLADVPVLSSHVSGGSLFFGEDFRASKTDSQSTYLSHVSAVASEGTNQYLSTIFNGN